jgi:PatG C-terminal/Subtilase family/PatG Domain
MKTPIAALPGMRELWDRTKGDPRIRVAVLDGPVDRTHPCFAGARLTSVPTELSDAHCTGRLCAHGTHVASMIFGGPASAVPGVAPASHGLLASIYADEGHRLTTQRELSVALGKAAEAGAHVINVSGGELTNSGQADPMLADAVRRCEQAGILIVAAAGNDACRCLHVPAALPAVLAVGAMNEDGLPLESSNWGDVYQRQGILAPGHNMPGAAPGGGVATKTGTSYAAPVVSGIVALILALQLARGTKPDALAVAEALLSSAIRCDERTFAECERFLVGRLNIPGALSLILNPRRNSMSLDHSESTMPGPSTLGEAQASLAPLSAETAAVGASEAADSGVAVSDQSERIPAQGASSAPVHGEAEQRAPIFQATRSPNRSGATSFANRTSVIASDCSCKKGNGKSHVFAIGSLNYDFGTEARRDSFKQRMPSVTPNGLPYLDPYPPAPDPPPGSFFPPNPYDARQMVNYLGGYPPPEPPFPTQGGFPALRHFPPGSKPIHPAPFPESPPPFPPPLIHPPEDYRGFPAQLSEATELIWTLNIELTPVYAIRPAGNFSTEVYQRLVEFLAGQVRPPEDEDYVSRVSIPGTLTGETVQLFSGQIVPVLVPNIRGMYAWNERQLVLQVLKILGFDPGSPDGQMAAHQVRNFLRRVYYELRNLGQSSQERALNYAGTNAFQAASIIVELATKYPPPPGTTVPVFQLQSIGVERSPFCRIDSDCWDVTLKFFYPDNVLKARDLYSYTIDVSDPYPVAIGTVRTWSAPS